MIIDKLKPYWKPEEEERLQFIRTEQAKAVSATLNAVKDNPTAGEARREEIIEKGLIKKWVKLEEDERVLLTAVETRYIKNRGKKGIMADIVEIVDAIEKADFTESISYRIAHIATMKTDGGASEEVLAPLRELAQENFDNCYSFILHTLRVQLNALAEDEASLDKVRTIIEKRVALWYVKPQPAYLPMVHGKATDALTLMNSRGASIDRITGDARIDKFGVEIVILKFKSLQGTLGINTSKLLDYSMAVFTHGNDFRHKGKETRRDVSIPLKEYASYLGYDVEEHETSTPEEAEREKKRAKNQLDNARKAIRQDLDIIHATTLTWGETVKGKSWDYARVSLATFTDIRNGMIKISFSPELASYLSERGTITQYPVALLRIPAKNPTAYYIGKKLAEYYNLDNNQIQGTHDRLSIPKILEYSGLASYEEVQATDRGHWVERIKEPLERALDTLTQVGMLKDWEYTHAKAVPLTEEEAYTITSYEDFSKLYIHFTLADAVDHTERIGARIKALEERKARTGVKRKRKKPADKKEG